MLKPYYTTYAAGWRGCTLCIERYRVQVPLVIADREAYAIDLVRSAVAPGDAPSHFTVIEYRAHNYIVIERIYRITEYVC